MLKELFHSDLPIYGIWQDNGILPNGSALPLGKSSVTIILSDLHSAYTMEVEDDDVLALMQADGFDSITWASEDARQKCSIRSAIVGNGKG